MEKDKEMTKEHRLVDAGLEPVDIIEGIAYLDKLAVNMTTSKYLATSLIKSTQPGRTST